MMDPSGAYPNLSESRLQSILGKAGQPTGSQSPTRLTSAEAVAGRRGEGAGVAGIAQRLEQSGHAYFSGA